MSQRNLMLLAMLGSAGLLGGAFIFQLAGYPPCQMCLWQRWPHAAALLIGLLALVLRAGGPLLPLLGALAAASTAAIGLYHTGVERDWWQGPASCTGSGTLGGLSGADLLATEGPRLIMCDQVSWEFLALSMASWNALFSLAFAVIWLMAARRGG